MLKYLKNSFKDTLIYGLGSIAVKISGFILIPVYTRYFSIYEYGMIGILEATSIAFIAILSLSLYQSFFIFYWDPIYNKVQKQLFTTVFLSVITIALFLISISYFSLPYVLKSFNIDLKYTTLILFFIIASGLQIVINIPAKLLQLQSKVYLFTFANILMLITNIFFTLYFIIIKHYGIESLYISQSIGCVFYLTVLSKFIIQNLERSFNVSVLSKMINYSLPLIFSSIAVIIISFSDRYIIKFSAGFDKLGIYSLGAKLANTISVLIIGPIQLAINPIIVKIYNENKSSRFFSKIMTYMVLVCLIFILILSNFSLEFVKLLTHKPEYWAASLIIPLLAFAAVFSLMKDLGIVNLQLAKKPKVIRNIIISISIITLLFNFVLISNFGFIGAGISYFISQVLFCIVIHFFSYKYFKIDYEFIRITKLLLLSAVIIITSLLFNQSDIMFRILIKLFLIFCLPIFLYFLNFFEPIELLRIKEFWYKWKKIKNFTINIKELFIQDNI